MRRGIIAAAVVVVLVGAGLYAWPYATLYQIKRTYDAKDVGGLIGYIDFAALKQDITAQAHAQARKEAAVDHAPIDPQTEAIADDSINSMVNPSAVKALLSEELGLTKPADDATQDSAGPAGNDSGGGDGGTKIKDWSVTRTALDTFVLNIFSADKKAPIQVTFKLHGLGWKAVGLRLPDDTF